MKDGEFLRDLKACRELEPNERERLEEIAKRLDLLDRVENGTDTLDVMDAAEQLSHLLPRK